VSRPQRPAKLSERVLGIGAEFEAVDFAKRRDARRRKRDLAKAARKRNRK
jgi:hypothetical protein